MLSFALSSSRYLEFTEDETIVNWMPLDHVGGIVMMHVFGTALGCNQVHARIDSFIGDPLKWMDWLTEYKATYSWAPNFAYGLVNEQKNRLKDRNWDLSHVKYILNGGEAVSPKTALQFLEHLAPYGMAHSIMLPAPVIKASPISMPRTANPSKATPNSLTMPNASSVACAVRA